MGGISVLPSIPLPPQPPLAPPEEVPSLELVPLEPAAPLVAPTANASTRDEMDNLLRAAAGMFASDLHLHSGMPIMVRLRGLLTPQPTQPFPAQHVEALVRAILTPVQQARLDDAGELDFAYGISGVGRFRANVYRHQRGMDATFRIIPDQVPTMEQLGLPPALQALTKYHNGMVLFTGPAGCGKSTSLASLLNVINQHHHGHILTIEDPIEYVHRPIKCSVNQRQVGPHTESFARALKGALREDPDVIVIGEMRDLETISLALSAAETGHLVLATLHTSNAIRTVNRIINAFPPSQQDQVRAMLSESLRGVVSQRLVRTVDGSRRLAALEVMMVSKAVGNLIRENKTLQIRSILQTGSADGNYLLDNSLLHLFQQKIISKEEALLYAEEPKRFG